MSPVTALDRKENSNKINERNTVRHRKPENSLDPRWLTDDDVSFAALARRVIPETNYAKFPKSRSGPLAIISTKPLQSSVRGIPEPDPVFSGPWRRPAYSRHGYVGARTIWFCSKFIPEAQARRASMSTLPRAQGALRWRQAKMRCLSEAGKHGSPMRVSSDCGNGQIPD
ncbi:uncharacterized protein N7487_007009 [Penicillium crustosum]|uniref:uncharacterized protein n=1 Tax=Penicillium crustosum TaxID=36656 RepID=UPI0023829905|nr:uncharacterized protein N7487_007009 [Penicillium crustosum]KAJ5412650.1 hypothetical protein N7487_007009 [Penicillium crustosum]